MNPADPCSSASVPESEIETLVRDIRSHPEYTSTDYLRERYQSLTRGVIADALGPEVVERATGALDTRTPYSVIRINDGEMNLLSFDVYQDTPHLDRFVACATVSRHRGSFGGDETWLLALREMMMSAILQADVVGVPRLWRPEPPGSADVEQWVERLRTMLPGFSGQWRGIDYLLRIAVAGALRHAVIASAHLYIGVLRHLEAIFDHAGWILLITDRSVVVDALRRKYPRHRIDHIPVGVPAGSASARSERGPRFLYDTASQLPRDLQGCCGLVGAGPWAEIYCTWIKQRGGVGIDLGSGFDLLAGTVSRWIHRRLGYEAENPFALHASSAATPDGETENTRSGGVASSDDPRRTVIEKPE